LEDYSIWRAAKKSSIHRSFEVVAMDMSVIDNKIIFANAAKYDNF
jgi:hypothetical protein